MKRFFYLLLGLLAAVFCSAGNCKDNGVLSDTWFNQNVSAVSSKIDNFLFYPSAGSKWNFAILNRVDLSTTCQISNDNSIPENENDENDTDTEDTNRDDTDENDTNTDKDTDKDTDENEDNDTGDNSRCMRQYDPQIICEEQSSECTFQVVLDESSCEKYCADRDGRCLFAYYNVEGHDCVILEPCSCDQLAYDMICTCTL